MSEIRPWKSLLSNLSIFFARKPVSEPVFWRQVAEARLRAFSFASLRHLQTLIFRLLQKRQKKKSRTRIKNWRKKTTPTDSPAKIFQKKTAKISISNSRESRRLMKLSKVISKLDILENNYFSGERETYDDFLLHPEEYYHLYYQYYRSKFVSPNIDMRLVVLVLASGTF